MRCMASWISTRSSRCCEPRHAGPAQADPRHQHCRDQPHHRRRARGDRHRPCAPLAVRSGHRHGAAGHRAHLAGFGRAARRSRRPHRARQRLAIVGRGRAGLAGRADAAGNPAPRTLRRWRWSWRTGVRAMPARCSGWMRRRRRRWRRRAICCSELEALDATVAITATGPRHARDRTASAAGAHAGARARHAACRRWPRDWRRCCPSAICCAAARDPDMRTRLEVLRGAGARRGSGRAGAGARTGAPAGRSAARRAARRCCRCRRGAGLGLSGSHCAAARGFGWCGRPALSAGQWSRRGAGAGFHADRRAVSGGAGSG